MPEIKQGITSFLESKGEILILLRSKSVSTYQGIWGGVSGGLDEGKTPDQQALLEIKEETGLSETDFALVKRGPPLAFYDSQIGVQKIVYPYLFHVKDRTKIRIDWEHQKMKWIRPSDIDQYQTMPKLKEALASVLE
jgi:8-oxo-dGTP pyrophosphatase MutT (NUDIX family)